MFFDTLENAYTQRKQKQMRPRPRPVDPGLGGAGLGPGSPGVRVPPPPGRPRPMPASGPRWVESADAGALLSPGRRRSRGARPPPPPPPPPPRRQHPQQQHQVHPRRRGRPDLGLALGACGWDALRVFDAALAAGEPVALVEAVAVLAAALSADAAAPSRAAAALHAGGPGLGRGRVPSVRARAEVAADPSAALAAVLRRDRRDARALEAILEATGRLEGDDVDGGDAAAALAFASSLPRDERTRRVLLGACSAAGSLAQTIAVVAGAGPGPTAATDGAATILAVAGKAGAPAAVGAAFDAAFASGVCGDTAVMNAAISAWVAVGAPAPAFAAYVACRRAGAAPNTRTLNALVRAARAAGDLGRVRRLWARALRAASGRGGCSLPGPDR